MSHTPHSPAARRAVPSFTNWFLTIDAGHIAHVLSTRADTLCFGVGSSRTSIARHVMNLNNMAGVFGRLNSLEIALLQSLIYLGGTQHAVAAEEVIDYVLRQAQSEAAAWGCDDDKVITRAECAAGLRELIGCGVVWGPDTHGWFPLPDHTGVAQGLPPHRRADSGRDMLSLRHFTSTAVRLPGQRFGDRPPVYCDTLDPSFADPESFNLSRFKEMGFGWFVPADDNFFTGETNPTKEDLLDPTGVAAGIPLPDHSTSRVPIPVPSFEDAYLRTHVSIDSCLPFTGLQIGSQDRSIRQLHEMITALPAGQRNLLMKLHQHGGLGTSAGAAPDADPNHPVRALIDAGVLIRIDESRVLLPMDCQLVLERLPQRPEVFFFLKDYADAAACAPESLVLDEVSESAVSASQAEVDAAALAAVEPVLTAMGLVQEELAFAPYRLQPGKKLGPKKLKELSTSLPGEFASAELGRAILDCVAAGALELGAGENATASQPLIGVRGVYPLLRGLPLAACWWQVIDGWLHRRDADALPESSQYAALAEGDETALVVRSRTAALVVDSVPRVLSRDEDFIDALTFGIARWPVVRLLVLASSCRLGGDYPLSPLTVQRMITGAVPCAADTVTPALVAAVLETAQRYGLIAKGLPSTVLNAWMEYGRPLVARHLLEHLPQEVEQLIVQADRTVITPGPLSGSLQVFVDAVCELEHPGLSSMYRLTESSVASAMRAGLTGDVILDTLEHHSMTGVPDTVRVLIFDVAGMVPADTSRLTDLPSVRASIDPVLFLERVECLDRQRCPVKTTVREVDFHDREHIFAPQPTSRPPEDLIGDHPRRHTSKKEHKASGTPPLCETCVNPLVEVALAMGEQTPTDGMRLFPLTRATSNREDVHPTTLHLEQGCVVCLPAVRLRRVASRPIEGLWPPPLTHEASLACEAVPERPHFGTIFDNNMRDPILSAAAIAEWLEEVFPESTTPTFAFGPGRIDRVDEMYLPPRIPLVEVFEPPVEEVKVISLAERRRRRAAERGDADPGDDPTPTTSIDAIYSATPASGGSPLTELVDKLHAYAAENTLVTVTCTDQRGHLTYQQITPQRVRGGAVTGRTPSGAEHSLLISRIVRVDPVEEEPTP